MEPNNLRPVTVIKVATYGFFHSLRQIFQGIGLGKDRFAQRSCNESALGGLFNYENEFFHCPVPWV